MASIEELSYFALDFDDDVAVRIIRTDVFVSSPFKNPYLTLRLLMSYIYMEHPFLMFLDHTQLRSKVGRTPLDE